MSLVKHRGRIRAIRVKQIMRPSYAERRSQLVGIAMGASRYREDMGTTLQLYFPREGGRESPFIGLFLDSRGVI